jgi:hypothetical protein
MTGLPNFSDMSPPEIEEWLNANAGRLMLVGTEATPAKYVLATADSVMVPISLRVSKAMLDAIETAAKTHPDGRSGLIRAAVERYLSTQEAA